MRKKLTFFICLSLFYVQVNAQNEDVVNRGLTKFEKLRDSIFPTTKSPFAKSIEEQYIYDRMVYENYLDNVIKRNQKKGLEYSYRENVFYDDIEDADYRTSEEIALRELDYFTLPIKLKSGDSVIVNFGRTKDFVTSYQKVINLVITSLTEVLNNANENLLNDSIPPIKQIYISASSNGKHSKYSNHYKKEAIDISRINGQMIAYHQFSYKVKEELKDYIEGLNYNDYEDKYYLFIEGTPYNLDEIFLWDRLKILQEAILNNKHTRENYGPYLNTKYDKNSEKLIEYDYVIPGHHNHIHYSVR
ncbi:hypothetical protein [Maribacter sp. 2304DJ31-5]|uniref:hypothetical protein n=1 Tax=Maribacter sp. 2304DJ31-5 TaxID=3386273 RepID=UPI0039BCB28C